MTRSGKLKRTTRDTTVLAMCAAILIAVQVALAVPVLPNIELVSLLVILYTLTFKHRVLYIIYTFSVAEGLIWGFQYWWFSYLYVWTILAFAAWMLRRMKSPVGWAVLSGSFGLLFGALCAPVNLFVGGLGYAVSWWVSGISFDLIHGAANFALCLALWKPLGALFMRLTGITPTRSKDKSSAALPAAVSRRR